MGKQAKRTIKFNKASKQKHSFMNISRKVPLQKLAEEILLLFGSIKKISLYEEKYTRHLVVNLAKLRNFG